MLPLAVMLFALSIASVAEAEAPCPNGLVRVDASQCCWPDDRSACVAAPTFPVHFEAGNKWSFSVSVEGASCKTPCDLPVVPGLHRVEVTGDASFYDDVQFPAAPSVVKVEKRRGGRLALAIIGLSVGIPVGAAGLALAFSYLPAATDKTKSSLGPSEMVLVGFFGAGAGFIFAALAAGVGFSTFGHDRAWVLSAQTAQRRDPPVRLVSLGVAPTRGGASVGATFAF